MVRRRRIDDRQKIAHFAAGDLLVVDDDAVDFFVGYIANPRANDQIGFLIRLMTGAQWRADAVGDYFPHADEIIQIAHLQFPFSETSVPASANNEAEIAAGD